MMNRHDLIDITKAGRKRIYTSSVADGNRNCGSRQIRQLVVDSQGSIKIPGIVRREENHSGDDIIPVGFSSPFSETGRRLRYPAFVYHDEIEKITTPYEILAFEFEPRTGCLEALKELRIAALEQKINLGVWGSAGLEIYTGLEYTHDSSDLDLLIAISDQSALRTLYSAIEETSDRYGCRIDTEIRLPSGYGVQAAEFFGNSSLLLAKGINDVILIPRNNLFLP